MHPLNFPPLPASHVLEAGWLWDPVRKRSVQHTPEEWVRQHLVHYFISHCMVPKGCIRLEHPARYARLRKRIDVLIYNPKGEPWLLAECKAPQHPLGATTWQQASSYNQQLKAPFMLITNGHIHQCLYINPAMGIQPLAEFPKYGQALPFTEKPQPSRF